MKKKSLFFPCFSGLLLLFAIVAFNGIALSQTAHTVPFSDDFETQDFANWVGPGPYASVQNSFVHSGNWTMQSKIPNTSGFRDGTAYFNLSSTPNPLSVRFFFYLDTQYVLANGDSIWILRLNNGSTFQTFKLLANGTAINIAGDNIPTGTTNITKGAWHSLEVMYTSGSGTGALALYLDGSSKAETSASGLTLPSMTQVVMGALEPYNGDYGTMYFDDMAVSGTSIGAPPAGITVRHGGTFNRTNLKLDVTLYGYSASDQLVVNLNGSQVSQQAGSTSGRMTATFNLSNLAPGKYTLQTQLLNSTGAQKAVASETITKYGPAGTPSVAIDEDNAVLVNGVKTFLVSPFSTSTTMANSWLSLKQINYNGWVDGSSTRDLAGFTGYINAVNAPTIGPNNFFQGNNPHVYPYNTSAITNYCTALASNPNILMWTWDDETDMMQSAGSTAAQAKQWTDLCHAVDTNHPVALNWYGYTPVNTYWMGFLATNVVDMNSFDMYPYWSQCKTDHASMWRYAATMDAFQRYTYGLMPWGTFVETFADFTTTCGLPSAAQLNMEAWLNVVHGIKSIEWFNVNTGSGTVPQSVYTMMTNFQTTTTALQSAILAKPTSRTVTSSATVQHNRVDAMVREDANYIYVFAVRLTDIGEESDPPITSTLTISGGGTTTATVYGENRTVAVNAGVISDTFNASAVHIYQLPKSGTPPPPVPTGLAALAH